jgi:hypothetical protein
MRRILRQRPSPALAVSMVALVVAVGGVAVASIPAPSGVIKACYGKRTGTLRVIDSNKTCSKKRERTLSWNQRGPIGPEGAQGASGKDGAQGPPGPYSEVLPSGKTLKGALYLATAITSYDFAFSLPSAPVVHVRAFNASPTAECPGSASDPQAAPGHLCVYQSNNSGAGACVFATDDPMSSCTSATKFGFGGSSSGQFSGQWAVTAP